MRTPHIRIILLVSLLLSLAACTQAEVSSPSSFTEPDPAVYVSLAPVVWEYFYFRKAAVLSGELDTFYARFPALTTGADPEQGINAEAHHVAGFQGFDLLDGDIFPEYYERFKIKHMGDQVQILAHGMELYLYRDAEGVFNQSGGEFKLVLSLRPAGVGWQLFQTDQVTQSEWQGFRP